MENKKRKYVIIGILVVIVIIDIILFYFAFLRKDTVKVLEYKNEYISFEYKSDYSLKEKDSKNISLGKNDKSGQINITITELTDEVAKRDPGFIINGSISDFESANEDYYASYYGEYKTKKYVVKDFLYDDNERQVDMNYIVEGNKLILISYVNSNQYFDLYEPNVLEIINSIEIQ